MGINEENSHERFTRTYNNQEVSEVFGEKKVKVIRRTRGTC